MINGEAVTIDMCFNCYWREKFVAEGDGILREEGFERERLPEPGTSASGIRE